MDLSEQYLSLILVTIPFWMRQNNLPGFQGGGAVNKNVQVHILWSHSAQFYGFLLYSVSKAFTREPVSVTDVPHLSFLENTFFLSLFVSSLLCHLF